ncbi:hypothetical protein B2G71_03245 [Novosphingobium sp. PC22D]|uniref:tyrosine-protein phosphatase n=1 Tax=Novosphingobium sp. PC22D TaxID=1962403 RepID=UPI000BEF2D4D|nr:tyrosine-protein phosphatase [Novosphingobium sp. PC22D]PEQ14597.1 hypothetical protein B2G71_03245 [Novosphingobium sp. PC22D]
MDEDVRARLVPLEGGINFRDMGGYATRDGRRLKWRHLYRSGSMARLTQADYDHLAALGIRAVVDFRSAREQRRDPNAWCRVAGITYWCRDHNEVFGRLHEMVEQGIESEAHAEEVMAGGFRELPFQQAPAYVQLVKMIAAGEVPIAFNCTAGKDRTGGAAALVLAVLGVPRETIVADFTMTERAVDLTTAFGERPGAASPYAKLSPEVMNALRAARAPYISAFLDSIEARCGSAEGYLTERGVAPGEIAALREILLERA